MTAKFRIQNRIRFTLFVVASIILFTVTINFALDLNTASSSTKQEYTQVKVVSGDTLWSIADTYMPDNPDIRKSVYQLCQLNDINADELYAGMTILVQIFN